MTQPNPAHSDVEIVERLKATADNLGAANGGSSGVFAEEIALLTQAASTISRLICERDEAREKGASLVSDAASRAVAARLPTVEGP